MQFLEPLGILWTLENWFILSSNTLCWECFLFVDCWSYPRPLSFIWWCACWSKNLYYNHQYIEISYIKNLKTSTNLIENGCNLDNCWKYNFRFRLRTQNHILGGIFKHWLSFLKLFQNSANLAKNSWKSWMFKNFRRLTQDLDSATKVTS